MNHTFTQFKKEISRVILFTILGFFFSLCTQASQKETSNNAQIRINEFMASNSSSIVDKDGDYSDWIEIYNSADDSISLEGWSLTDTKLAPREWSFPPI